MFVYGANNRCKSTCGSRFTACLYEAIGGVNFVGGIHRDSIFPARGTALVVVAEPVDQAGRAEHVATG